MRTVIAATLASLLTGCADAHAVSMHSVCQKFPCVYDQHNSIVGVTQSLNTLLRRMGGNWYQMNYSTSLGLDTNLLLSYSALNCAGQPYMSAGGTIGPADLIHPNAIRTTSPVAASYDGINQAIWAPVGDPIILDVKSFLYEGQCTNGIWGVNPIPAAPASKLEAATFHTPLTIR
jgi:hypothetical protein